MPFWETSICISSVIKHGNGGYFLNEVVMEEILNLVGGFEHFSFSHILGVIIPIDQYFFREFETTSQELNG